METALNGWQLAGATMLGSGLVAYLVVLYYTLLGAARYGRKFGAEYAASVSPIPVSILLFGGLLTLIGYLT